MLWLIPVLLSFDIIEAIVPVIIILILIAAAAGLTRGTDIFALFGLGTIMGFANAGSGRVGKGLKGTRYGADAIKRGRAAGKAKGGLIKRAKKAGKNYKAAKAKVPAIKNKKMMKGAKLANRRLKRLQAKGKGNSFRAKLLRAKLNKLKNANIKKLNAQKVASSVRDNPGVRLSTLSLAGGLTLSTKAANKLTGKKMAGRASQLNTDLANKNREINKSQKQHLSRISVYKKSGLMDFEKIPIKTRNASISSHGVRIGHVPKFNNYVKTISSKTGTQTKVLKIPKSAFVQKGVTTAIAMSLLQKHWTKQIEAGGPHAGRAEKRLGKLNDIVAKMHYGASSSGEAFKSAAKGELRSKNAKRLENIISFGLPVPGGRALGGLVGRRFGEKKLERLPNEDYWSTYRSRRSEYEQIRKEMDASKDHTLLHPIAGRHGPDSIKAKRQKVWDKAYKKALKGIK